MPPVDKSRALGQGMIVGVWNLRRINALPWFTFLGRFVRKLEAEDVEKVQEEAERLSDLGKVHADEFNPYGQAYLQAEAAL